VSPLYPQSTDIARPGRLVRFVPIVLKNSKIAGLRKSRNCSALAILPLQGAVESIRGPVIVFAVIHVALHLAAN
jgi:hypothetical protein